MVHRIARKMLTPLVLLATMFLGGCYYYPYGGYYRGYYGGYPAYAYAPVIVGGGYYGGGFYR